MSDDQNECPGNRRREKLTEALDAVGAAHDALPRSRGDFFLTSMRRICTAAERMLAPDGRRDRSENQTAAEPPPSHRLGAIAEHLAAKTIATFGGRDAVRDLRRWTRRAQPKDRLPR